jgi:hypothetical protein
MTELLLALGLMVLASLVWWGLVHIHVKNRVARILGGRDEGPR